MDSYNNLSYIYCTWGHRKFLPKELSRRFKDLDHFLKQLLSSAKDSILIIAPYLTTEGINLIKNSLSLSAERGAWIKIVTGNIEKESDQNRQALKKLIKGDGANAIRSRLRLLIGSKSLAILLHSKIVIIDSKYGYLGSANITFHAFEKNFEVGVALSTEQSISIDSLVSFWESTGLLVDSTSSIIS